jgi:hypothetical protein
MSCIIYILLISFRYFVQTWTRQYKFEDWVVGDSSRRTNNEVESFNRSLKDNFKICPNVWQFLSDLRTQASRSLGVFAVDSRIGNRPRQGRTLDTPLRYARNQLDNGHFDVADFLDYMARIKY